MSPAYHQMHLPAILVPTLRWRSARGRTS